MLRVVNALLLGALIGVSAAGACEGIELYVSPQGNDSWSGRLKEPNNRGSDGPFATLERARDAIRALRESPGGVDRPVTVYLRGGTYCLGSTFTLTPEDLGTQRSPVTYAAYPGERATISGGMPITGFRPAVANGRQVLAADVPEVREGKWNFMQLFVNNRRRPRTRLPKQGWFQVAELIDIPADAPWNKGQDRFRFGEGDIRPWSNLLDVDVVALHFWIESRMPIRSVDESSRVVELGKSSTFRLSSDYSPAGARYFVENVFEALDTPGQWYLDRSSGTLYYYPFIGEDTKNLKAIAPVLERLVKVGDGADDAHKVRHVTFRDLIFSHTEHRLPDTSAGSAQAAVHTPGAVLFERAEDCEVVNCEISRIGAYAIEVGHGCSALRFERNRITDLGAGGIKVNEGSEGTTIIDNEISDGGKIFMSAVGVWIGNSPANTVAHNHIHNLDYTGVSVGWRWGYGESKAIDNRIKFNHIHHVGRGVLSDLAGIYTLGVSPGTRLANNHIHDCYSYSYGGWGLYTDEGSTGIVLENNVVHNTKTGSFHQHYGKENIIRNNILAFSREQQLQRTRQEEHISFTFERNIVYYDQGELLGSNWGDNNYRMDHNLYWDTRGRPITFAGASLEDWRKRGHDVSSLIADPLFVNPEKRDFTLKPGSPALTLGFKPIDLWRVGPRDLVGPRK